MTETSTLDQVREALPHCMRHGVGDSPGACFRHRDDRNDPCLPCRLRFILGDLQVEGSPAAPFEAPSRHHSPVGLFVAFEGHEGCGKSTQSRLLAEALAGEGRQVTLTREPGAGVLGQAIRSLLLSPTPDGEAAMEARTEALLFAADRAQHVNALIVPALSKGGVVITDRYTDSTMAYQGAGRALSTGELNFLTRYASDGLTPHLTVLLNVPLDVGMGRVRTDEFNTPDRMESEEYDFHVRVHNGFKALAEASPDRYLVCGDEPVDAIHRKVLEAVTERLRPGRVARRLR